MEVIHKKPGAIGEGQERALINSNMSGRKVPQRADGGRANVVSRNSQAQLPRDPNFLSITVNKANGGPLHHFIYYFNDYIPHCLAIVSLID